MILETCFQYRNLDKEKGMLMMSEASMEALSVFAEAAQDLVTAGLEVAIERFFICADFCNQSAEKSVQSVSLQQLGHKQSYSHDLRSLGDAVHAPEKILQALAELTPFHPEIFYAQYPSEIADDHVSFETAQHLQAQSRLILDWARSIVVAGA